MINESENNLAVERTESGKVMVTVGDLPAAFIAPEHALKLACLLMKYAGASVRILSGSIVATFSKKSLRAGPKDSKPIAEPGRLLN